ncbi:hypothetical protein ACFS5N_11820 [Mucilaginibacter ximonensis]|uniref:Lipoprotein n=1 Tax=Mucilaginibacter ximonensis TaxID=538021 RepID=A0ABW5YCW1_9SPHI
MKYLPLALIALCLAACSSPQKKAGNADTVKKDTAAATAGKAPSISTHSFIHHIGQDTTLIDFTLINDRAQGIMDWMPHDGTEGHSGVIQGTLKNDTIHAVWGYAVGRSTDTMSVELLFKDSADLRQKPLIKNAKTGRLQTDENAGFTILYKPGSRKHR